MLLFEAMAGLPAARAVERPAAGELRLGLLEECFAADTGIDRAVAARSAELVDRLAAHGAACRTVSLGAAPSAWRAVMEVIGGYESLRRNRPLLSLPHAELSPAIRTWLAGAAEITPEHYRRALARREALSARLLRAFDDVDLLLSPTAIHPVPPNDDEDARRRYSTDSALAIFNLSGHPAMSIPIGRDEAGLPVGLQVTARRGDERRLAAAAELMMNFPEAVR